MLSGTAPAGNTLQRASWNDANIGKAEKIASVTVTSGTSEISVVKVRLLAVRPRWSSRKRSRSVRKVSRPGLLQRLEQQRDALAPALGKGGPSDGSEIHCWHDSQRCSTRSNARRGLDAARGGGPARPHPPGVFWELRLAPTGSGMLALKVLPLTLVLPAWRQALHLPLGLAARVAHFIEGVVRASGDCGFSAQLAGCSNWTR